jgi:hypothetical protein
VLSHLSYPPEVIFILYAGTVCQMQRSFSFNRLVSGVQIHPFEGEVRSLNPAGYQAKY